MQEVKIYKIIGDNCIVRNFPTKPVLVRPNSKSQIGIFRNSDLSYSDWHH